MLDKIDTIYENGFRICDMQISRIIDIYGKKEQAVGGFYPTVCLNETQSLKSSSSSIWLMCKHRQMKATNFNDVKAIKKNFAGMYCVREHEMEYIPEEDLYKISFITYTVGDNGVKTKEVVILYLDVTKIENKTFNFKDTSRENEVGEKETEKEVPSNINEILEGIEDLDYDF